MQPHHSAELQGKKPNLILDLSETTQLKRHFKYVCVCVYRVPYCGLKHIRLLLTCYLGMVFAPWSGYLARSATQDQGSNQVTTTTISISVYIQILGWGKGRGNKTLKELLLLKAKIKQTHSLRSRCLVLGVLLGFSHVL